MGTPARKEPARGPGRPPRRRGRPPAHDGGDTRAAILAAAQRLFGVRGYAGVSMDALAADCGLNPRALYYYFPSKRELFDAATADALARFGSAVTDRVFSRTAARDRVHGYLDVFRSLHASDPHLVPFVGTVLVDSLADDPQRTRRVPSEAGDVLRGFLEVLVDDALARGELEPGVDREGALTLLVAIGMGVALASIDDAGSFPAMLDVLERLNDGTLYRPAGTSGSVGSAGGSAGAAGSSGSAGSQGSAGSSGAMSAATGSDTSISSNATDPPSRGRA